MVLKKGLIFAMLFYFALVSPSFSKQGETRIISEVKTIIAQHNQALGAHDLKGVMTLYSSNPDIFLMGTGPGETYLGEEGIAGAYNQIFSRFKADSLTFKTDCITAGSKGDLAWFAVTTTISGTVNNELKAREFNLTGLLHKQKGKWRIINMHFSRLNAEEQPAVEPTK